MIQCDGGNYYRPYGMDVPEGAAANGSSSAATTKSPEQVVAPVASAVEPAVSRCANIFSLNQ